MVFADLCAMQAQHALWCFNTQIIITDHVARLSSRTQCAVHACRWCMLWVVLLLLLLICAWGAMVQLSAWPVMAEWLAQHIRVIGQPLMRPVSDDSEQCVACSLHFKIPDGVSFNLVICYVLHWVQLYPTTPLYVYMAFSPQTGHYVFMKLHQVFLMLLAVSLQCSIMLPPQPEKGSPPDLSVRQNNTTRCLKLCWALILHIVLRIPSHQPGDNSATVSCTAQWTHLCPGTFSCAQKMQATITRALLWLLLQFDNKYHRSSAACWCHSKMEQCLKLSKPKCSLQHAVNTGLHVKVANCTAQENRASRPMSKNSWPTSVFRTAQNSHQCHGRTYPGRCIGISAGQLGVQ